MSLALQLAQQGQGSVEPNPMVGCVIVRDDQIIGQGFHQAFGGPHAEVVALRSLVNAQDARDATVYVTLEPCCHHGKTPPCTGALRKAEVRRVVAAMRDPFPQVAGGGLALLQAAGIDTHVGLLEAEARRINAPYLKRTLVGRPWTIAKWAMTVDGKIATVTGESQWISGPDARRDVHQLRARVDAIVVGMGTVLADDPTLTARDVTRCPRVARRVVMCRHRLPALDSRLVKSIDQAPLLLAVGPDVTDAQIEPLRQRGAEIWRSPSGESTAMIDGLLAELSCQGSTNVMIEGGGELMASFVAMRQVDEFQVYLGPKIFGGAMAPGPVAQPVAGQLVDSPLLHLRSIEQLGEDVKLTYLRRSEATSGE